jgi:hypothetical protein
MRPDIDVRCGHFPRRWRVVMIRDAKGNAVAMQKIEGFRRVPAPVTEFENIRARFSQPL